MYSNFISKELQLQNLEWVKILINHNSLVKVHHATQDDNYIDFFEFISCLIPNRISIILV